jgi:putative ABC transport system permease protein
MRNLLQDLRYASRALLKNRGFAAVVTLILALAIGVNSVLFSFVNLLMLRRLPIRDVERVAFVEGRNPQQGAERLRLAPADFLDYRERSRSFAELGAYTLSNATLTGSGEPVRLTAARATASFFRIFGLRAARGRVFTDSEDRPGGARVVVLSHGAWTRRFGGDPAVVGRALLLDSQPHEVIGVLTPEIEIGGFSTIELWRPLALDAAGALRNERVLRVTGRLAKGFTLAQADGEVRGIARQLQQEHPLTNSGYDAGVLGARESLMGGGRVALVFTLLGVIVLGVLGVACANVANLVLSRALVRRRELAIRAALGASSRRLLRQLLTEGALLGAAGGAAGLGVAWVALRVVRAVGQEPIFALIVVDGRVMLFAAVLSLLTPLAFSAWPALAALRDPAGKALRETGGRGASDASGRRARTALVVSQLALACALLVGASLVVRSVRAALDQDWGYDWRPLATFAYELPIKRYPDAARVGSFGERLLASLRAVPEVEAAAAIDTLPILGGEKTVQLDLPGREPAREHERPWAVLFRAGDGAVEALGVPLLRGRTFEPADGSDVALVTRTFAEAYLGGLDAVGRSFVAYPEAGREPVRLAVLGVLGDIRSPDRTDPLKPTLLLHMSAAEAGRASVVVRARRDPAALLASVRAEVRRLDPELALQGLATVEQLRLEDQSSDELISGMFGAFALVALLMAAMGLYASMAYFVSQRTQEIGIRIALGASGRAVLAHVLGRGARLGGLGVALGLLLGLAIARGMASLLYGVTATDPVTYAGVALSMLAIALGASAWPAWRATRVDPIRTLKAD